MKHYPYCVFVEKIHLFATIGLYEEELLVENEFEISLKVCSEQAFNGSDYIDYECLVSEVQNVFKQAHQILELVAEQIFEQLKNKLSSINFAEISIKKLSPAIKNTSTKALGVEISKIWG